MDINPWAATLIILLITLFDFFVALAKSAFEHVSVKELQNESQDENGSEKERAAKAIGFIDKNENHFYNACWLIRGIAWIVIGMLFVSGPLNKILESLDEFFVRLAVSVV